MIGKGILRQIGVASVAIASLSCFCGLAVAHVQVTPEIVAPNDSVKFSILVPGERAEKTTRVELKVPSGVVPYSFGDTPGWTREAVESDQGTVDRVIWTGSMSKDSFVVFDMLAATPEQPATLSWKAIQTYADGETAEWIGPEDSDEPAAITRVSKDAPRESAGVTKDRDAPSNDSAAAKKDSVSEAMDPVARALAGVALGLGMVACGLVLIKRSKPRDS